ncbi:hypothetical protein ACF2JD_18730 [Aeromonas sp. A-5]|uniref:hypothetical protein n=1 Tax=Aeromonas ichthyocola TaxID=3367746 RepID=UPI0038DB03D5
MSFGNFANYGSISTPSLSANPTLLKCKLQYESSPLGQNWSQSGHQGRLGPAGAFLRTGTLEQGLFIDLPVRVLQALSLSCVVNLVQQRQAHEFELTQEQLETVIRASWNAILNPNYSITGACS